MRSSYVLGATACVATLTTLGFAPLWVGALLGTGLISGGILAYADFQDHRGAGAGGSHRARSVDPSTLVAESHSDVVLVFTFDGMLVEASASTIAVLGLDPVDLAKRPLAEMVHGDDLTSMTEALGRATSTPGLLVSQSGRIRGETDWLPMRVEFKANAEVSAGVAGSTGKTGLVVVRLVDVGDQTALFNRLSRAESQLDAVRATVDLALKGRDETTLVTAAIAGVREALALDSCELYTAGNRSPELEVGIGPGGIHLDRRSSTLAGSALAAAVSQAGEAVHELHGVADTQCDPPLRCTAVAVPVPGTNHDTTSVLIGRTVSPQDMSAGDLAFMSAVANVIGLARRQRGAEQDAFHRSRYDRLTGLVNKELFLERVSASIRHCQGEGETVGVLLIDLDHFKVINDSLGHEAGDAVIEMLSELFKEALRPGDTLARFGGDEFVVLLRRLGEPGQAVLAAERLLSVLNRPLAIADHSVHMTASVGVSTCADPTVEAAEMVRQADAALYRAKELGRERIEVFTAELLDEAMLRLETEEELYAALDSGQLRVLYQPIVDTNSGKTTEVEALLRWVHPRRGLVSPGAFLPISESTGLIEHIGAWVIDAAAKQARSWSDAGEPLTISVNLSPRQLADPDLADTVARALDSHGIEPALLAFEVSEAALVKQPRHAIEALNALIDLGVGVVIDDFGTGVSSLPALRALDLKAIKVDRSLIAAIGHSGTDYAIVSAVVALARALSPRVVAEGVETDDQLELVRDLGCDSAQGFLFSPAVLDIEQSATDHFQPVSNSQN